MKTIARFLSILVFTLVFTINLSANNSNESLDDYWYVQCLDAATGTGMPACVDWEASPVPCSNYSWPCSDFVLDDCGC